MKPTGLIGVMKPTDWPPSYSCHLQSRMGGDVDGRLSSWEQLSRLGSERNCAVTAAGVTLPPPETGMQPAPLVPPTHPPRWRSPRSQRRRFGRWLMRRMQLAPLALPQKTVAAQLRGGGPLAACGVDAVAAPACVRADAAGAEAGGDPSSLSRSPQPDATK